MRLYIFSIVAVLTVSFAAYGQKALPVDDKGNLIPEEKVAKMKEVYSSVFDIRKFKRFQLITDSDKSKPVIRKTLEGNKSLEFASDPLTAQFYLNYQESSVGSELRVFYFKEDALVIVWVKDSPKQRSETALTKEFLKVFERNQAIK